MENEWEKKDENKIENLKLIVIQQKKRIENFIWVTRRWNFGVENFITFSARCNWIFFVCVTFPLWQKILINILVWGSF